MQFIVFGVNGYIGSYIFKQLKKDGFDVKGTSRKIQYVDDVFFYDIQNDNINSIMPQMCEPDKTAIICIAEPKIDICYENYGKAYDINVTKTKKLINELRMEGFHVIYFSSDNVFDGMGENYTEESPTYAINKYGMMKAEMEQYLLGNCSDVCIFRIPKVVSASREKQNIFEDWLNQIKTGRIRCIKGNNISFVYIDDVYQACLIAAEKKLQGLYNIAGDNTYSRAELARKFIDKLQIKKISVQECDLAEFSFKDQRPLNIGMKNLKFRTETGYKFIEIDSVMETYIDSLDKQFLNSIF